MHVDVHTYTHAHYTLALFIIYAHSTHTRELCQLKNLINLT